MIQKMDDSDKLEQKYCCSILELNEDWKSGLAVLDEPLGIKSASYRNFCLEREEWQEVAKLSRGRSWVGFLTIGMPTYNSSPQWKS